MIKIFRLTILSSALLLSSISLTWAQASGAPAGTPGSPTVEEGALRGACSKEAKAARCNEDIQGATLIGCIQTYQKSNPTYQLSKPCTEGIQDFQKIKKGYQVN